MLGILRGKEDKKVKIFKIRVYWKEIVNFMGMKGFDLDIDMYIFNNVKWDCVVFVWSDMILD